MQPQQQIAIEDVQMALGVQALTIVQLNAEIKRLTARIAELEQAAAPAASATTH